MPKHVRGLLYVAGILFGCLPIVIAYYRNCQSKISILKTFLILQLGFALPGAVLIEIVRLSNKDNSIQMSVANTLSVIGVSLSMVAGIGGLGCLVWACRSKKSLKN